MTQIFSKSKYPKVLFQATDPPLILSYYFAWFLNDFFQKSKFVGIFFSCKNKSWKIANCWKMCKKNMNIFMNYKEVQLLGRNATRICNLAIYHFSKCLLLYIIQIFKFLNIYIICLTRGRERQFSKGLWNSSTCHNRPFFMSLWKPA